MTTHQTLTIAQAIETIQSYASSFQTRSYRIAELTRAITVERYNLDNLKMQLIMEAPDGILDGKNDTERRYKLDTYLADNLSYSNAAASINTREAELHELHALNQADDEMLSAYNTIAKLLIAAAEAESTRTSEGARP